MDPLDLAVDIGRSTIVVAIMVASPLLLTGLAVGVIVSIIQAATQIQEQTLIFVPKILGMMVTVYFFVRWIAVTLIGFSQSLIAQILLRRIDGPIEQREEHQLVGLNVDTDRDAGLDGRAPLQDIR